MSFMKGIKSMIADNKAKGRSCSTNAEYHLHLGVNHALEDVFKNLLKEAKSLAAYCANPLTPESGREAQVKVNLISEILGLESDDDWKPLREAYENNKPK